MSYTARGLAFRWTPPFWGALRDTANAAHLALVYARHAPAEAPALRCWAASQLRCAPVQLTGQAHCDRRTCAALRKCMRARQHCKAWKAWVVSMVHMSSAMRAWPRVLKKACAVMERGVHRYIACEDQARWQQLVDSAACRAHRYILGGQGRSMVGGAGKNPPQRFHHRAASCPWPPMPCNWSAEVCQALAAALPRDRSSRMQLRTHCMLAPASSCFAPCVKCTL